MPRSDNLFTILTAKTVLPVNSNSRLAVQIELGALQT